MLLAITALPLLLAPQGGADTLVARFQLDGTEAFITAHDLGLELARRYQKTQQGRAAVRRMVDLYLVRQQASAAGLMPKPSEVRQAAEQIEQQLRSAGQDFEESLAGRNMTRREFEEDFLPLGLAHRNLVVDALGLDSPDQVGSDMLELWLRQAREQATVIEDPEQLPAGYAARVGDRFLSLLDLGLLLIRSTEPEERERFINQIVILRCLDKEAAARSIEVTEEEARAEVQARKEAADRDALYGGLRLEQVLSSQGMTVEELVHWPVLRAQIIERKLVDLEQSPDDLRARLEENRADVLKLHGPRRQLALVFTRALEEPNELVPRDFAAAKQHLGQIRDQIRAEGVPFSAAALRHSEDPFTSTRGGAAGWHRQTSQIPSPEVIQAAFALDRGDISDPIRTGEGYYLVKVIDIEPMPDDAHLIKSLRRVLEVQLRQRILEQAQIELL